MSNSVYDQIKLLYDQHLFSNVVNLVNLVLTASDHNPPILSASEKLLTYIYYGNSLFEMALYRRAEAVYRQAIQFKKSVFKSKTAAKPNETVKELISDVDIKYQLHLCCVYLHQSDEAINILQSISAKQRTPKVNMALAKLYQQAGNERPAITAYKEVLRECPMALEAAEGLINMGVSGAEVNALTLDANVAGMDWLNGWIKAKAQIHSRDYGLAINTFKQLDERSPIRGNRALLVALGETYYYSGDSVLAMLTLQKANSLDPNDQRGLDVLAALLSENKYSGELEKLVPMHWTHEEHGPEAWTALSYLLYVNGNLSRAAYLAQKGCFYSPKNVEALILKGKILYDLKKYPDAIAHFREAYKLAPYRYEPHKGLVDCYVATHRVREAITFASNACKQLNNSARALTLYASVLMKDPISVSKAKSLLEKALNQNESYLPAVYLLADLHEQEMNLEAAVDLLEKQVQITHTTRLHLMLGDLHGRLNDDSKAFEHYNRVLSVEPNNLRAQEGLTRLDGGMGGGGGGVVGGGASNGNNVSGAGRGDTSYFNVSDVETIDNAQNSDHEDSSELSA